jgi:hypothetical protein
MERWSFLGLVVHFVVFNFQYSFERHPFKIVVELIYSSFFSTFMAPLFHALFPDATVLKKPRLQQILSFFRLIMSAYSEIRLRMLHFSEFFDAHPNHRNAIHFLNLVDLLEFYIPVALYMNDTLRDSDFSLRLQLFALTLFISVALNSRIYTYGCLLQFHQLFYWKKTGHLMNTLLERFPEKFMEVSCDGN